MLKRTSLWIRRTTSLLITRLVPFAISFAVTAVIALIAYLIKR